MSVISAGTTAGTAVKVTGNTDGTVVIKTNDTGTGGTTAATFGTDQRTTFAAAISAPGVTNSALTSGRVTYSTTGGQLTDSANLTFSGNLLAVTGTSSASATNTIFSIAGSTSSHYVGLKVGSGANLVGRGTNVDTYWTSNTDLYTYTNTGAASYLSLNGAAFSWNVFGSGTGGAALGAATTVISGSSTGITVTGSLTATTLTPTNALGVAYGGTGQTSYTVGDLLYASGTTTLSKLADVATGNALISGGVGVAPSWGKVGLTTHVSGTLPVANGGTGNTSGQAASVANALTVINNGTGVVSGSTYNGSGAVTISYNSVGAPSTTGTNASGTWGINVTGTAGSISGYNNPAISASASTIAYRDGSGDLTARYYNQTSTNNENPAVSQVCVTNGTDNYWRKSSIASFTGYVQSNASGTWGINISGNAATATTANNGVTTTSGSPAYYGARAWVNFNGTTGGIRASVNVSSVTRNGTGDYYVNFSTAMPDANSSVVATCKSVASSTQGCVATIWSGGVNTTYVHFYTLQQNTSGLVDSDTVCVATFR